MNSSLIYALSTFRDKNLIVKNIFETIIVLILQFIKNYEENETRNPYKGIQMVVGHYNGNLAAEKRANLTDGTNYYFNVVLIKKKKIFFLKKYS